MKKIIAGVLLTSFGLAAHGAMVIPKVEDLVPTGTHQQMSAAEAIRFDPDPIAWSTLFSVDPNTGAMEFMYFGDNTSDPFMSGTTTIDFKMGEDPLSGSFSINEPLAAPQNPGQPGIAEASAVVLTGTFEGGQLFVGADDGNPIFKLIGFVKGDGGVFGPDGSAIGIILDFAGVTSFRSGFLEQFGTANVFTVVAAPPNGVPEGSTVLLLMAGGLSALTLSLRRRHRPRATT